ncbi:hypothetical protein F6X37_32590 [Paraburkholderia sp. 31.1]|nr:hypothetical protein [Paraburkholderia sp. 31.1]
MELWIQVCAWCADHGVKSATESLHQELTLKRVGAVKDARAEEHCTRGRCGCYRTQGALTHLRSKLVRQRVGHRLHFRPPINAGI